MQLIEEKRNLQQATQVLYYLAGPDNPVVPVYLLLQQLKNLLEVAFASITFGP
jgi:hypothetical protein